MKFKILFFAVIFATANTSIFAQTLTPQKNSKSKWGYVNEKGKAVIKYKYDEAQEFSEDLAVVATAKYYDYSYNKYIYNYGYIDKNGKVIIPIKYAEAKPFSEGLAKVKGTDGWGFIDKTGNEVISMKYAEIGDFSEEGLAKVRFYDSWNRTKYWGFVDKTGKEVIPVKYTEIGDFSEEGLAKVRFYDSSNRTEYWGFVDKTGKEVIPVKYTEIGDFSEEGLAKVRFYDSSNRTEYWGFVDKTGKEVIPVKYTEIGDFSEGLAKVEKDGKSGFIDKTGKVVIPLEYDNADNFSEGFALVYSSNNKNKWGVIDKAGTLVLPIKDRGEPTIGSSLSALVQKEEQKAAEINMLIEEVEAVLDNDYYSDDCHSVEVLDRLYLALDKLEKEKYIDSEDKKYLSELKEDLVLAYRQQVLTKKYGATTAKKIINGKYEIGMSKEVVYEILRNNRGLDMRPYYEKSESSSTETWSLKWGIDSFAITIMDMAGIDRPTLIIRNDKLTNIIR